MKYDLTHLTQDTRRVYGPVQDDEALLLYALVRCLGVRRVLEIGGQTGYSARNFLAAGADVWTVDIDPVAKLAENHTVIHANIATVDPASLPVFDLVFYDCHALFEQRLFHGRAVEAGVIDDHTTLIVHDTGLHREKFCGWSVPHGTRWAHQPVERNFVDLLAGEGWQRVHVHADDDAEPRHGLTILQRPRRLT